MKATRCSVRLLIATLGGILLLPTPAAAQAPLQNFGPFIEQTRRDWGVPGVAVAVVKDDQIVFVQGYGVRTQGQSDAVNADTAFQLASVTKTFTAAALGALVDHGKLGWDTPVMKYLPGFAMNDPYATLHTSARDLLPTAAASRPLGATSSTNSATPAPRWCAGCASSSRKAASAKKPHTPTWASPSPAPWRAR